MDKKLVYALSGIVVLLTIACGLGISYALWKTTLTQEEVNVVQAGCFNVTMTNQQNAINLENAFPLTDEEGMELTPFTFTLTNTCGINSAYTINLEMLEGTTMLPEYVASQLNDDEIVKLSSLSNGNKSVATSVNSKVLATGIIKANASKEFSLRLWMDKDVTISQGANTILNAKVVVENAATNEDGRLYSIVADENGNGVADIGDEIAIGDEHFYVISNDGTTINALAKYNLNAGNLCTSLYSNSCTPISNPTYKQDEAMTGYIKVDGTWKYGYGSLAFSDNNGWPYSNNDTIDIQSYDGPVKTAINAYKEILPEGVEVRLITKAEIEALVNDGATLSYGSIKDKADAKGVSWIYSTSYWSGSAGAFNANDVWNVNSNGSFSIEFFDDGSYFGVRPVISLES